MFDDVLKTSKASKKNKVEEVKPTAVHASQKDATKTKDPIHEDMSAEVVTTTAPLVDERREAPKKRKSTGKRTDPTYKQVGAYVKKDTYLKNPETIAR